MPLVKRTYALPEATLGSFEKKVPTGERSAVVASLMQDWLDRDRRQKLRQEIIEGCRDMAEIYLEVEREYHPAEEEIHRAIDSQPKARRGRARPARSRGRLRASG